MGKIMKKKQLMLSVMIVALAAAVFANWYYTKPKTTPVSGAQGVTQPPQEADAALSVGSSRTDGAAEYFASVRLQRDTARDAALKNVRDVMLNLEAIDDGTVGNARQTLEDVTRDVKLESDIETLVRAKTGTDCVAVINGDAIQVIVPKEIVDDTLALRISDIVLDNSDIKSDNIKIIGAE